MRRFLWLVPFSLLLLAGCRPNAVWSPDGKHLALDPRGNLFTYNLAARKFQQHTRGPKLAVNPVWAPDGTRLAYHSLTVKGGFAANTDLMALDLATGRHSVLVGSLRTADVTAGEQTLGTPPELLREMMSAAWSPDGKKLAYTAVESKEPTLWVANADGSEPKAILKERQSAYSIAWSPDSERIAFLGMETPPAGEMQGAVNLEVVRADGTERKMLWEGAARGPLSGFGPPPRWTEDGKSLWVVTDLERKEGEPFGTKAGFWRVPADGVEKPVEGPQLGAPPAFLTVNSGGAAFFFAPKDSNEKSPRVGFAGPALTGTMSLGELNPAVLGVPEALARDVDGFPVPSLSPDAAKIAVAFVPKAAQPVLLLYPARAGGKPERIAIPLASAKPAVKPAAKKPPAKKPVRKRR